MIWILSQVFSSRLWWIIYRIHSPIREEATLMHWENHSNRCPFSLSFWQYFNIIPIFEIPIMNVDIETIFWCSLEANPCQEIVLIGVVVEADPCQGIVIIGVFVEADPFQGIVIIGVFVEADPFQGIAIIGCICGGWPLPGNRLYLWRLTLTREFR